KRDVVEGPQHAVERGQTDAVRAIHHQLLACLVALAGGMAGGPQAIRGAEGKVDTGHGTSRRRAGAAARAAPAAGWAAGRASRGVDTGAFTSGLVEQELHQQRHGAARGALVFAAAPGGARDVEVSPAIRLGKARQEAG